MTGPNPHDAIRIEDNILSCPEDLKAVIASVELCREIGDSAPLRSLVRREVMPGNLKGSDLESFIRDTRADVRHDLSQPQPQRLDNAIRHLPGVPGWIVEVADCFASKCCSMRSAWLFSWPLD